MGAIDNSVEIAAPPETVFEFCSNMENELRWNPMAEKAAKVSEGPIGVGTTYRAKWKRSPEMDVTCVAYDADARTWTNHNGGPVEVTSSFTVAPADGGSRLTSRFEVAGHGIGKVFAPLLLRQMRSQVPVNMARIKTLLESESPSP